MALSSTSSTKKDLTEELRDEFYSSTYRKVFTTTKLPLYHRKRVCNILCSIQEGALRRKISRYEVSFNGTMNQVFQVTENRQNPEDVSMWLPKFGSHIIRFQNILNLNIGAQIKITFYTPNDGSSSGELQLGRVLIDLFDPKVFAESKNEARLVVDVTDFENKNHGKVAVYIQAENLVQQK
ncbi:predicted protein [Naegleria gruberi]|uniref:Predicted protein n=1 Tax=Naegleria gruberi TaxID=5762 RepID=D2VPR4_NAEGR|nr:uncharacterized protein NAEGRDRAFT_70956 [Naegleria gruberi]EFC41173.1 predicted protein [Naegleria gruberi]|eukprot:XP_002673917.1 predicted protein [Naegleria gruberi strain NEG-M]